MTKGGDEETGAARVTADEWILQDMRCQQVHTFCHVCYARVLCTPVRVCAACMGAGHAASVRTDAPRAQRRACLRIQASGRVGAHRGGDGRQGAAPRGERHPQERQADQPGQVVRGTCTVVHCSCTLQRPAFAMGTSCRWRRYLPRLKGLKSDYSNAPATDDE